MAANFCGRAEHERSGRNFHSHGDQRVCADNGTRADFHIVKNDGPHANQHFIVDLAGMDHRIMSDGHQLTHGCRIVCIDMNSGVVLNIRARADNDAIDVAAEHSAVPNTRFLFECHVTNDGRAGHNPCA